MRRRTLLAGLALGVAGCSRPVAPASSLDVEAAIALGKQLTAAMAGGDYQSTIDRLAGRLKGTLNATQLQAAWDQTLPGRGKYQKLAGSGVLGEPGAERVVVVVIATFEGGDVACQFSFNAKQEIDGLYLRAPNDADRQAIANQPTASASPADYRAEEVKVGELGLRGVLALPPEGATAEGAAVVLVGGSGPTDLDGTVGANHILRDLAEGLVTAGIPALRFNKRYAEQPPSDPEQVTLRTEILDDVDAAIELLASHAEVAGKRIVVVGHSLGGMLTPRIVATHPDLAGGAILAGSPRHLADIMHDQLVKAAADDQTKIAEIENQTTAAKAPAAAFGLPAGYWESIGEVHASLGSDLRTGRPFLLLHGDADGQVPAATDYEPWSSLLAGVDAEKHLLPGLNHLLMPAGPGGNLDYNTPSQVAPEALGALATWCAARS